MQPLADTSRTPVTVLMPAYNAGHSIGAAIDSVLQQTHAALELLIVDDGSTDDTAEVIRSRSSDPRIRVLHQPQNRGLVSALQFGLSECNTDLVARLDADDFAAPTRLARQVRLFEQNPRIVLSATGHRRVSPDGTLLRQGTPPLHHGALAALMLTGNRLNHSSVMYRADAVRSVGGYRDQWFPVEDYDLWIRLLSVGEYHGLDSEEVTTVNEPSGISMQRADEQVRQHTLRTAMYIRSVADAELTADEVSAICGELPGTPSTVSTVDRCARNLRATLAAQGIPTLGLDQAARHVAARSLVNRRRLVRQWLLLRHAPRLAILGVRWRRGVPNSPSSTG